MLNTFLPTSACRDKHQNEMINIIRSTSKYIYYCFTSFQQGVFQFLVTTNLSVQINWTKPCTAMIEHPH